MTRRPGSIGDGHYTQPTPAQIEATSPKPAPAVARWHGDIPKECDICHDAIKGAFVDGATSFGPWANMCLSCFAQFGRGLGTGRGQKYSANTGIKIAG